MMEPTNVPSKVKGEPDLTRAASRIILAYRDSIAYDNPAKLMAPSKIDMERVREAIIANDGNWEDIRAWVMAATKRATEHGESVSSVRYGLKAWSNEQERKRREKEKRAHPPDVINPGYHQPAPLDEPEELTEEEHAAVMARLAEIRARLGGET